MLRSALAIGICLLSPVFGRAQKSPLAYDPASLNEANSPVPSGKKTPGILRAQILLSKAGFSPGEIDGAAGKNLARAITGFQQSRNIPATGSLDEVTWAALNENAGQVIATHTLSAEDVAGPFQAIPSDMMQKASLKTLGFTSVEEKLAEQFHISTGVLKRLNTGKTFTAGVEIHVPDKARKPVDKAAHVYVTKATSTVTAVDAQGKVLRQYVASTGSEHDPLPIGEWQITGAFKNPAFHYNPELFWDADPGHSKAKIAPGPNNPVGLVWIDLTKEHYGIHGTPNPATVGHAQSHGCIRLTNWDALELADLVGKGTPVTMREQ